MHKNKSKCNQKYKQNNSVPTKQKQPKLTRIDERR